jgi:type II secretory pathway component PulJ
MRANKLRSGGYTLSEMVVSIGLASLLLIALVETSFYIAKTHERSRVFIDINSAALGAFSRFSRDIRRATSIDTVNSTFEASSGKIVLLMKKSDGTNDVVTFYLDGTIVKEDFNGSYVGEITPPNIPISNLTFRLSTSSPLSGVRIEMTAAPDTKLDIPAINFYSTYVLRGSYAE